MRRLLPLGLLLGLALAAPAQAIRGSDGTWMPATDAYTGALKKVVNPSMEAYPASRLAKLLASDQPVPDYQAQVAGVVEPPPSHTATDGGGIAATTAGLVGGGALALVGLLLFAARRRRHMVERPSAA